MNVNQSSDSKTVNFVADVSTAQIADLVVIKDGSVAYGSTANTLRVRVTDAFGNALDGQTVSVLADNSATVVLRLSPSRTDGGDFCYQPDGGSQCGHRQYQQQQPEPERDVCCRCQDGEHRRSGGH
ncbi:Ig-like domain-containing protein [Escherichia coli]